MDDQRASWDYELATHREIQGLFPRVSALRVWLRPHQPLAPAVAKLITGPQPGTDEDGLMCALACKAANTHNAIRLLAEAGHGDEASALARVLQENAVLLQWLRVQPLRLGIFAMAEQVLVRWAIAAVKKVASNSKYSRAADRTATGPFINVADTFGDIQVRHLFDLDSERGKLTYVSAKQMIKSVSSPTQLTADDHDLAYVRLSTYVHSSAAAVRHLLQHARRGGVFTCDLAPNAKTALEALRLSNLYMLVALSQLCEYANLEELQAEFDVVKSRIVTKPRASDDEGDTAET